MSPRASIRFFFITLCAILWPVTAIFSQAPSLELQSLSTDEAVFQFSVADGSVFNLERSLTLQNWAPVHSARADGAHAVPVDTARAVFYRGSQTSPPIISPTLNWADSINYTAHPFLSTPSKLTEDGADIQWIKFHIFLDDLTTVYFQSSSAYPFHYPFATAELGPFIGLDLLDYDTQVLRGGVDVQSAIAGTVLFAPDRNEFGIELLGETPYSPEWTAFLYRLVASRIGMPGDAQGFYMPLGEQFNISHDASSYFESQGITLDSTRRWQGSANGCYSNGWASGRLRLIQKEDIDTAFTSGQLRFDDILVTDEVPREVPDVAGIITFTPSTPNSHVALLAQSRQTPFVFVQDAASESFIADHLNTDVLFRVVDCEMDFTDISTLDATEKAVLTALKAPAQIEITPVKRRGSLAESTDNIEPGDLASYGGKAANFGVLRDTIPDNSPAEAIAFSFDLWLDYLAQTLPTGKTLRQEIDARLQGEPYPPADIEDLAAKLEEIRDLIKDTADFSGTQKSDILEALTEFDPGRKIRFRSSTNVEDSANFSGAGLYDSFSGCVADDTDNDEEGPSHCDPEQPKERGVFRAIRKVFASFYNVNAYLARLKHGVGETDAGMAILVHYSFPDEIERANGVFTYPVKDLEESTVFGPDTYFTHRRTGKIVTQPGAESVTNPSGSGVPEVMTFHNVITTTSPFFEIGFSNLKQEQRAGLLPLGETNVLEANDYQALFELVKLVHEEWLRLFPGRENITLDFEFKKIRSDETTELIVKQVREIPRPEAKKPVLFESRNVKLCPWYGHLHRGNSNGQFGAHRLKSRWTFDAARLIDFNTDTLPAAPFFTGSWDAIRDDEIISNTDSLATETGYASSIEINANTGRMTLLQTWKDRIARQDIDLTLRAEFPDDEILRQCPVVFADDLEYFLEAVYPEIPQPNESWGRATESIAVLPCAETMTSQGAARRETVSSNEISVTIDYEFVPNGHEPAGELETRSLRKVVRTQITGLTSDEIILTDYWSQTGYPQRHNWNHWFVLQPALSPGLSSDAKQQLKSADIQLILVTAGLENKITYVGYDGVERTLP